MAGVVKLSDLMEMFGVSSARADQLTRRPNFPKPLGGITQPARIWDRDEVEDWAKENRPPKDD